MNLTYTVADVLTQALSKLGVNYAETEAKNREDAHRAMNIILGAWSADPDMAVNRIIPPLGYQSVGSTITLPDEYIHALILNLAVNLSSDYDQKVDKVLFNQAAEAVNNIKIFNVRRQSGRIPHNGSNIVR